MELLSMILVDDEPIVVKKLLETYDWNTMGFRVVGAACGAEEAWKMIEELQPDLVLSDVRLKKMDGLAMIDKVREAGWNTDFVVVSAYHDFELMQKACQNGALSYLVKPFEEEELTRTMADVHELCMEKKKNENIENIRDQILQKHKECILEKMAGHFLKERISAAEMAEVLRYYQAEEKLNQYYAVIQAGIDSARRILDQKEYEMKLYMMELKLRESLEKKYTVWTSRSHEGMIVYIVSLNKAEGAVEDLKEILSGLRQKMKTDLIAVISQPEKGLEGMKHAYQLTGRLHAAACGAGPVILIAENTAGSAVRSQYSVNYESLILSAIRRNDRHQMKKAYESFVFTLPAEEDIAVVYMHRLVVNIEFALEESQMLTEEMQDSFRKFYRMMHEVSLLKLVSLLYQLFVAVIEQKTESAQLPAEEYSKKYIAAAVTYIREHLHEEKLSISSVADSISLNPSYFGSIFNKTMHMPFKKYILNMRMERAKELLAEKDAKIEEICLKVGIPDADSFAMMFKDSTGVFPEEYRG